MEEHPYFYMHCATKQLLQKWSLPEDAFHRRFVFTPAQIVFHQINSTQESNVEHSRSAPHQLCSADLRWSLLKLRPTWMWAADTPDKLVILEVKLCCGLRTETATRTFRGEQRLTAVTLQLREKENFSRSGPSDKYFNVYELKLRGLSTSADRSDAGSLRSVDSPHTLSPW